MTKETLLKLIEESKATFIAVDGTGSFIKITDKSTEELSQAFSDLYDNLLPGTYTLDYRVNKNDSKGSPKVRFKVGEGQGSGISGIEAIGGPSTWAMIQENQDLKQKIRDMEFDQKMQRREMDFEAKIRGIEEKAGSGFDLDKLSKVFTQISGLINAANTAKAPTSSGTPTPASPVRPTAVNGVPETPDNHPDDGGSGHEVDESDEIGQNLNAVATAMGPEAFAEICAALGTSAKEDPDAFRKKIESMKAFL